MFSWESVDMSATITLSQPARIAEIRRAQPSEATYRRRRAVVGTLLAVFVAVGAVLTHDVLAGSSGAPASAAESQPALTRIAITALPGDTLWSIGQQHHGAVPIARYVDKLVDINGGPSIQAGQAVLLP